MQKKWQKKSYRIYVCYCSARASIYSTELTLPCALCHPRFPLLHFGPGYRVPVVVQECQNVQKTFMHFAPPAAETWTFLFSYDSQRSLHRLLRSIPTTFPFIASFVASFE